MRETTWAVSRQNQASPTIIQVHSGMTEVSGKETEWETGMIQEKGWRWSTGRDSCQNWKQHLLAHHPCHHLIPGLVIHVSSPAFISFLRKTSMFPPPPTSFLQEIDRTSLTEKMPDWVTDGLKEGRKLQRKLWCQAWSEGDRQRWGSQWMRKWRREKQKTRRGRNQRSLQQESHHRENIFDGETRRKKERRQTVNQSLTDVFPPLLLLSSGFERRRKERLLPRVLILSSHSLSLLTQVIDRFSSSLLVFAVCLSLYFIPWLSPQLMGLLSHWMFASESSLFSLDSNSSVEIKVIKGNKVKWCWREVGKRSAGW